MTQWLLEEAAFLALAADESRSDRERSELQARADRLRAMAQRQVSR